MVSDSLDTLCIMLAMQMRPDSSWSATLRKRSRGLVMLLLKLPASSTLENASSRDSLQHSTAYSTAHVQYSTEQPI
jgi:hypothetical protein